MKIKIKGKGNARLITVLLSVIVGTLCSIGYTYLFYKSDNASDGFILSMIAAFYAPIFVLVLFSISQILFGNVVSRLAAIAITIILCISAIAYLNLNSGERQLYCDGKSVNSYIGTNCEGNIR